MLIAAATSALFLLAILACPVGMGLMMWFMRKGMMGGKSPREADDMALPDLKAEQARLAEKIAALESRERADSQPLPSRNEEEAQEARQVERATPS